ncbi:Fructose-bisphosphate aldolase 1, partial [Podila epigama]
LHPELLGKHQAYIKEQLKLESDKPVWFVFHGGSGSTEHDIQTAVNFGVVKMNVDTDTQWAYWEGIKKFYESKKEYLQGQVGNPEGANKPNKKVYDPRVWVREAEKSMLNRVKQACKDLNNVDRL